MDTIAVYLQEDGTLISFDEASRICVHARNGKWHIQNEIRIEKMRNLNTDSVRDSITDLIRQMGGCRVIVGSNLSGLPYNLFDRAGFAIFDMREYSEAALDAVMEDLQEWNEERRRMNADSVALSPRETSEPGIYTFDLVKLQDKFPDMSSKKALQVFLQETPFLELRLICSHVPPWIDPKDYRIESTHTSNGKIDAVISKKG